MARSKTPMARAALDGFDILPGGPAAAGVTLAEQAHRGKLILRGNGGDRSFARAVQTALGVAPPTEPNRVAVGGEASLLWMRPTEWMALLPAGTEDEAAARLGTALADQSAAVVDVSDQFALLRLAGAKARVVMAKGCAIDLHPRVFGPGCAAQSHIGRIAVLFHQTDETPTYEILARRSLADYLWTYLADAGLEFGVRVEVEG